MAPLTSGEPRGSLASRVQTTNDVSLSNKGFVAGALAVALAAPGVLLAGMAHVRDGCRRVDHRQGTFVRRDRPAAARSYGLHLHLVRRHPRNGDMMHGLHHPDGSNNNDPPNLYVAGDGIARAEFYTTPVSLVQERVLLDTDGSAVIIHENPDHHMTQLIGGACGCIAYGIINANVTVDASATCCRAEYG